MKQNAIYFLVITVVIGAAFALGLFPEKEQLPPIPMVELKAEPPIVQNDLPAIAERPPLVQGGGSNAVDVPMVSSPWLELGERISYAYHTTKDQEKQIRALTKRIEELEKRTDPKTHYQTTPPTDSVIHSGTTNDYIYCTNATIEECYKQYNLTAPSR